MMHSRFQIHIRVTIRHVLVYGHEVKAWSKQKFRVHVPEKRYIEPVDIIYICSMKTLS